MTIIIWLEPTESLYRTRRTNYNAIDKNWSQSDIDSHSGVASPKKLRSDEFVLVGEQ